MAGQASRENGKKGGRPTTQETLEKRALADVVEQHINEEIEVEVLDRGAKTKIKIIKPRILIALEKLYEIGTAKGGNPEALKAWLDRALGKPVQPIVGDKERPILLKVDF